MFQVESRSSFSSVQGVMPVWRALLLVYRSIDADYTDTEGTPRHFTYTLTQREVQDAVWSFRQFASIANEFSNGEVIILYDIIHITRPLTSLTLMGPNLWWPSPNDTRQELDQYAPPGTYDSILVLWPQTDFSTGQQIPSGG